MISGNISRNQNYGPLGKKGGCGYRNKHQGKFGKQLWLQKALANGAGDYRGHLDPMGLFTGKTGATHYGKFNTDNGPIARAIGMFSRQQILQGEFHYCLPGAHYLSADPWGQPTIRGPGNTLVRARTLHVKRPGRIHALY